MAASDFGRDHGLMHEVVVSGREVGADRFFWAALAEDRKLFSRVRELVDSELIRDLRITLEPVQNSENLAGDFPRKVLEDWSVKLIRRTEYKLVKVLDHSPTNIKEWESGVRWSEQEITHRATKLCCHQGLDHLNPLLHRLRKVGADAVPVWLRKFKILLPATIIKDDGPFKCNRGIAKVWFCRQYDDDPQWDCSVHMYAHGECITHEDYYLVET